MADAFDKFLDAEFEPEPGGLSWIKSREKDDESGLWHDFWLLVQRSTDRVLVTIDGPNAQQFCYGNQAEGQPGRRLYLSLDGAKRNAVSAAMQILQEEARDSSARRKMRRAAKVRR